MDDDYDDYDDWGWPYDETETTLLLNRAFFFGGSCCFMLFPNLDFMQDSWKMLGANRRIVVKIGIQIFQWWMKPKIQLVGGWATPLKNMSSSIGMIRNSQYDWEHAKFMATSHHQPDNMLTYVDIGNPPGFSWGFPWQGRLGAPWQVVVPRIHPSIIPLRMLVVFFFRDSPSFDSQKIPI